MPELVVENLLVSYGGIRAVRGVSFTVMRGRIQALVGPNGAGKSSIARAIMGLVPASGRVAVGGQDLLGRPTHTRAAAGIGFVPEGRGTFAPLSVRDNILIGGYRADAATRRRQFAHVCDLFPVLGRRLGQTASSLSGGEQQMLAVARALMTDPAILICDEPTMGLAPAVSKTLFRALRTVADTGSAVLVGDQNARLVFAVADDVCIVRLGAVAARGHPRDFPASGAVARHYFGAERAPFSENPQR